MTNVQMFTTRRYMKTHTVIIVLILIAGLFLVSCGNEGGSEPTEEVAATVTPTEEAEPTSTAAPTDTPEPTSTPSPTDTPSPTATSEPVESVNNLGVSRAEFVDLFEGFDFDFSDSSDVDGRPRVMGVSPDGLVYIEVIGESDDVYEITLILALRGGDGANIDLYTRRALQTAAPDWEGATSWFRENHDKLEVSTIQGDRTISLRIESETIFLNVAPTEETEPTSTTAPTNSSGQIILTGSGDAIVDVEKEDVVMLAHIVGNADGRFFAVSSIDANNDTIDLLVNTTDPYDGVRPLDLPDGDYTRRFEVEADGPWTITLTPLAAAEVTDVLVVPGTFEGFGDYVFILLGGTPDVATISGNAGSHFFSVTSYGYSNDLLVNTTEPYEGTVLVDGDAIIIEVQADGAWSFAVTGR